MIVDKGQTRPLGSNFAQVPGDATRHGMRQSILSIIYITYLLPGSS